MSKDFFIPVFVSMLILFALVSCSKDDSRKVELDNISIKTAPLKVNYYTSEVLDLTGLEITLEFDNGTTQDHVYADFVSEDITTFPESLVLPRSISAVLPLMPITSAKDCCV